MQVRVAAYMPQLNTIDDYIVTTSESYVYKLPQLGYKLLSIHDRI